MNLYPLINLLTRALDETRCTPADRAQTLTVHIAERDGATVYAAVLETTDLRISDEWAA